MSVKQVVMAAAGALGGAKAYIEDVFSTYLYTGNSSTNTITNGIDLATEGGLVWCKSRASAYDNALYDTARGINKELYSNAVSAQYTGTGTLTAFNSDGFTLGSSGSANSDSSVSWTFRKAPKFFDVVTYTGTGSAQNIAHNLGSVPGCIIVKQINTLRNWRVYHRSLGANGMLALNLTDANTTGSFWWNNTSPTSTHFTVGTDTATNEPTGTYVAYLFAHDAGGFGDAGDQNVISCGSLTSDGTSNYDISLGWEPQWLLLKRATGGTSDWWVLDNMRGMSLTSNSFLYPNTSGAEAAYSPNAVPLATGFGIRNGIPSGDWIYIAIRRGPMKTPEDGTSVYNAVARTGTGAAVTTSATLAPDLMVVTDRNKSLYTGTDVLDRLRGNRYVITDGTKAESTRTQFLGFDAMTGVRLDADNFGYINYSSKNYIDWYFRRAPGFFDVVCYTGTGSARTVAHNLGVAPEIIIVKRRNSTASWYTYNATIGAANALALNTTLASFSSAASWNNTDPTSTVFTVNTENAVNGSGSTYVAYLFASCPGVSKVGSYTGNGSTQTIDCGFSNGARFVLIKRTDSTGDWHVFDTARGIVSGNDPYLELNTTNAEVTSEDAVDPVSSGFAVNEVSGSNINTSSATYIYLAIA